VNKGLELNEYLVKANAVATPQEYMTTFDLADHDSVYSYEDDCFAALSEHGDAANADCGEERDYQPRHSRTLPFRSCLARPLPLGVVSHTAHRVHALFFCFREYVTLT